MREFTSLEDPALVTLLTSGAVGILRTDTLYGIVASAAHQEAVERVYKIKGRDDTKPPIVLIANQTQLYDGIPNNIRSSVDSFWPGKVSLIMKTTSAPRWITRGGDTVAYRLPDHTELRQLLLCTGSLIAPSANPQGLEPASTVEIAKQYFGKTVDFYVDGGTVTDMNPSKLLRLTSNGEIERLR